MIMKCVIEETLQTALSKQMAQLCNISSDALASRQFCWHILNQHGMPAGADEKCAENNPTRKSPK